MPGIVFCKKRCGFGSDDLVIPAVFLFVVHVSWVFVFVVVSCIIPFDADFRWLVTLQEYVVGLASIYCSCAVVEAASTFTSVRGSVLNTKPRSSMACLLYFRLVLLVVEIGWQVWGITWILFNSSKSHLMVQCILVASILSDWLAVVLVISAVSFSEVRQVGARLTTIKRSSDAFVLQHETSRHQLCDNVAESTKSPTPPRRHSIHHAACCFEKRAKQNSFAEISVVLSHLLQDVDLIPTDIIAGLILLYKRQKLNQNLIMSESSTEVYQFLSGAAITSNTRFLSLKTPESLAMYENVIHFMRYPVAAYECLRLTARRKMRDNGTSASCTCCCVADDDSFRPRSVLLDENSCQCVKADLDRLLSLKRFDLVYASYSLDHDIDAIPFFIGLDHDRKAIVICIWSRLCVQEVFREVSCSDVDRVAVDSPNNCRWLVNKVVRLATCGV